MAFRFSNPFSRKTVKRNTRNNATRNKENNAVRKLMKEADKGLSGQEILATDPNNKYLRTALINHGILKNNKTLKRMNGSRKLTRNNNNAAMRFVVERMDYNLTGKEIRNQARNKNQNMRNRINKTLKNIGM